MDDVDCLAPDVDGILIFCGQPPKRFPCPVKGIKDDKDVGLDTMPPCVGLASSGLTVFADPTDGDVTVTVELPLFFTIPTKPVTVFPLLGLLDVPKYPDIGLSLEGLAFLPENPVVDFPFEVLFDCGFGRGLATFAAVTNALLVEGPEVGEARKPRISREPDGISIFCFLESKHVFDNTALIMQTLQLYLK